MVAGPGRAGDDPAFDLGPVAIAVGALAFLLELVAMVGLALAGWAVTGPTWLRALLAVLAPVVAAVVWGRYLAPRAPRPLRARVAVRALILLAGAAGFLVSGRAVIAEVMVLCVVVVTVAELRSGSAAGSDARGPAG
ncbi:MAG TPA: YrdB family protein [Candidatus Nanopelagicales bacterium]|jgi:hypothetical protein